MKPRFFRVVFCLFLGLAGFLIQTSGEEKKVVPETAVGRSRIDPKTDQLLKQLSIFYSGLKGLSVDIDSKLKSEMSGMKNEISMDFAIAMQRPNLLSVVSKSLMMGGSVVSDGSKIYIHQSMMGKYTASETEKDMDSIFNEHQAEITMMGSTTLLVFGSLLKANPYEDIIESINESKYIGLEKIEGIDCHHIQLVEDEIDFDLWIDAGKEPFLRKFVPDIGKAMQSVDPNSEQGNSMKEMMKEMKLEQVVFFKNWTVNPELTAEKFKFTPPMNSTLVDHLFQAAKEEIHPLVGTIAPDYKLKLLAGGATEPEKNKGQSIVVLDFWATKHGQALSMINEVTSGYKDKGVIFYAVNQRENAETIQTFLDAKALKISVAMDSEGKVGELFGVEGVPQMVVIDKDGKIQSIHVGSMSGLKKKLTSELDTLIAGKSLLKESAEKIQ